MIINACHYRDVNIYNVHFLGTMKGVLISTYQQMRLYHYFDKQKHGVTGFLIDTSLLVNVNNGNLIPRPSVSIVHLKSSLI